MGHALETILRTMWAAMFPNLSLDDTGPEPGGGEGLLASVSFSEGWTGRLLLRCSAQLGARLAQELYGTPVERLPEGTVEDLLAELVNVVGGNLGAALPGPGRMSLPNVVRGSSFELHTRGTASASVRLWVGGEPISLELHGE